MSQATILGVITLAMLAAIVYAWRRWGALGGIVVAIAICVIGGSAAAPIRRVVTSGADATQVPGQIVNKIVK